MIFSCDRCGHRYAVPDERVGGRPFRVTCKACGHVVVVRPAGAVTPAPIAGSAPAVQPQTWPAAAPEASAGAAPPAPRPAAEPWAATGAAAAAASATAEEPARAAAGEAAEPGAGPSAARASGPASAAAPAIASARSRPAVMAAALLVTAVAAAAIAFGTCRGRPPPPPPAVAIPKAAEPAAPPAAPVPRAEPAAEPAPEPALAPPAPSGPSGSRIAPGGAKVTRARRSAPRAAGGDDRRLLDLMGRKEDGAAADPVEALDLDTSRSLSPAAVERVVGEGLGAFSGCLTRALTARQPGSDARRATLLLTVDPRGRVSKAWVAEAEVDDTPLGACLASAARRLAFPAFRGGPVEVAVPLALEAR